jgi:outer membrane protein assembly factor BamB
MIGTNNEAMKDPKQPGDRGVLMAFNEDTGEFMWQATFEKLSSGRANDWPYQGIASSPTVVRGIAYFTSNRGQIIAADVKAFTTARTTAPTKTKS